MTAATTPAAGVSLPPVETPCCVWFNGRAYAGFVCAVYQNRVGVKFIRGRREQIRAVPWRAAPAVIARGTPAFAFEDPLQAARRTRDVAICDECFEAVPWTEATFLPFATLCGAEDCEVRARRKFDGLPADS